MPCSVSRAEEQAFEMMDNEKKYGSRELTSRITTRVACELGEVLRRIVGGPKLEWLISDLAIKWLKIHAKEDEAREPPTG